MRSLRMRDLQRLDKRGIISKKATKRGALPKIRDDKVERIEEWDSSL